MLQDADDAIASAARQHQQQRAKHRGLVAEPLSDGAARQRQRHARREIQSDQHADIGEADAEFAGEQRRDRRHALELEGHGGANREQNGEDAPAIVQAFRPHADSSASWDGMMRLSIAAHSVAARATIGIAVRFT